MNAEEEDPTRVAHPGDTGEPCGNGSGSPRGDPTPHSSTPAGKRLEHTIAAWWTQAPGVASEAPTKGEVVSVEENKAILRRGAEAFNNAEDRSAWFEIHDPSVIARGLGEEPVDLNGLKEFYSGLWLAFPDLRITIEDMVGEGDRVAWRLAVEGTHESEFRGIPATGINVRFAAQYFFRFRDGKIVERWTNFDRLAVLTQLGAQPAVAA